SVLYVPVAAVHLGLIVRIVSDTRNFVPGHQLGGVINVVGVLGFLLTAVVLAVRAAWKKRSKQRAHSNAYFRDAAARKKSLCRPRWRNRCVFESTRALAHHCLWPDFSVVGVRNCLGDSQ